MAIERLHKPASARGLRKQATGSADFGAIPKPTVTVRMKESAKCGHARALRHERAVCLAVSCALIQETCFQRHTMSQINDLPLSAITASNSSRGERIAFVEAQWHSDIVHQARDRHEFVANTVVSTLMSLQLETDVPIFSAVLTPHHFHEHVEHRKYFHRHFAIKGTEVAEACFKTLEALKQVDAALAA
jgi:6,7-dimethyl-8-ribityllumazine synthase